MLSRVSGNAGLTKLFTCLASVMDARNPPKVVDEVRFLGEVLEQNKTCPIRLLARSAVFQAAGNRSILLWGTCENAVGITSDNFSFNTKTAKAVSISSTLVSHFCAALD